MKILAVTLGSLFNLFNRHLHSETFQLANQPFALLVSVALLEVIIPSLSGLTTSLTVLNWKSFTTALT